MKLDLQAQRPPFCVPLSAARVLMSPVQVVNQ